MDSEILALQQQVAEKEKENSLHLSQNIFENRKESTNSAVPVADKKEQLVENMFEQAVVHEVANNAELQDNVLETAKVYTSTKMQTIKTKVDTEHKEAVFDNRKDACESYGFNEKTTPIWATRVMSWGYNVMLAIWLFIGSFTFMPIIFIAKKMSVGLKKTWLAVIFALLIYLAVTLVPILVSVLKQ